MLPRVMAATAATLSVTMLAGCGGAKDGTTNNTTVVVNPVTGPTRPYIVPSGSMEPTYGIGTHVLVQQQAPSLGAVAIFHPPQGSEQEECGPSPHVIPLGGAACSAPIPVEDTSSRLIKRIVAGPGDEIKIEQGHVFRKPAGTSEFAREKEPYIKECGASKACDFPEPVTIPEGHWFMIGDNRGESNDSRFWGPVPTSWIVGVVTGIE